MKLKKDKDTILLESAYGRIAEGKYMDLSKVAKNGMVGAHGNGMENPAGDYANNTSPHSVSDSITSHKAAPHEEEGDPMWHLAQLAFAQAVGNHGKKNKVDIYTVKGIAGHRETAKRYARYLIDRGIEIPKIIKNATKKLDQTTEIKHPLES